MILLSTPHLWHEKCYLGQSHTGLATQRFAAAASRSKGCERCSRPERTPDIIEAQLDEEATEDAEECAGEARSVRDARPELRDNQGCVERQAGERIDTTFQIGAGRSFSYRACFLRLFVELGFRPRSFRLHLQRMLSQTRMWQRTNRPWRGGGPKGKG